MAAPWHAKPLSNYHHVTGEQSQQTRPEVRAPGPLGGETLSDQVQATQLAQFGIAIARGTQEFRPESRVTAATDPKPANRQG